MRLDLSFRQTRAEQMVRIAASLIFDTLRNAGCKLVSLSSLTEDPQYGFTASADAEPVGPKFVRITDLQDGQIKWETVPYCECPEPTKYLLKAGDILFARTGATTGKTHLVESDADAVFASYLIRVRPRSGVRADYLYSFFQSDSYWSQIIDEKEGSAQPNVNGRKLMTVLLPSTDAALQGEIVEFLKAVRKRQDGLETDLPLLRPPLEEQRRIVSRIERLSANIHEAKRLRLESSLKATKLLDSHIEAAFSEADERGWKQYRLGDFVTEARYGTSEKTTDDTSGTPVLRMGNIQDGEIVTHDLKYLHLSDADKAMLVLKEGDIVVNRTNSAKLVGKCAVFKLGREFAFASYLIRLRIDTSRAIPDLLAAYINSSAGRAYMFAERKQMTGQANVNAQKLKMLPIRLPGVEEQVGLLNGIGRVRSFAKRLQAQQNLVSWELEATLPSIFNQAFSGRL